MNFYDNFSNKQIKIAHRGYRSVRAENTLSAFQSAIGKFDFIELDIQVTKDYELVVFHDYNLERTTNINNNLEFPFNGSYKIYDYTLDELRLLDIGSWFIKTDPFGTIKKQQNLKQELKNLEIQRIMTLDDILSFANQNHISLNIELKDCSYIDDEIFVKKVYSGIKKANLQVPFLISSFNHNYLKLLKQLDTYIQIAANVEEKHPENLVQYLRQLEVCAYHICSKLVDTTPIEILFKYGICTSVFTVNEQDLQLQYFHKGIRAIFTDVYCLS